jgi:hypothetical protein
MSKPPLVHIREWNDRDLKNPRPTKRAICGRKNAIITPGCLVDEKSMVTCLKCKRILRYPTWARPCIRPVELVEYI